MQRVMIIGQPGSGKSTLACKMAALTYLPVEHMDHIHWESGWIERDRAAKTALIEQEIAHPRWIFEGNHSTTMEARLARADTLIWLDLPLLLRFWRVAKRSLTWLGRQRADLPPGCPEQISAEFFGYIWRTRHSGRERCRRIHKMARADQHSHHLTSPAMVQTYLRDLERAVRVGNLGLPHR